MKKELFAAIGVLVMLTGCGGNKMEAAPKVEPAAEMMQPAFGGSEDVAYAASLWQKLEAKGFNLVPGNLYEGGPPHGPVREVVEGKIDGKTVIVKRNYGGEDVTMAGVEMNRPKYLKAVTVMAKREKGYDTENRDWFWVKYKANGQLHTNPMKMLLAGRIAKGMDQGCIACHQSASGNDLVFEHNKETNADNTVIH
jgi:hypothetical protein